MLLCALLMLRLRKRTLIAPRLLCAADMLDTPCRGRRLRLLRHDNR